ncbi:MAG: hypothetical protein JXA94_02860 [Parachlamydiales bacterium]|nr:hypothetical protein [Parachlamydiales bacterium]
MKKIVIISITVFLTIFIVFVIKFSNNTKSSNNCPFCDRKVINFQKFFEDSNVIGLCSYRPLY